MTSHIVVQARGQNSVIRLVKAGTVLQGEYESWILDTGHRILFVHNELHRKLKSFHLLGSFQNGAMYGFTYTETCALMREFLGQSDKDLYLSEVELHKQQKSLHREVVLDRSVVVGSGVLHITTKILLLTCKFILAMLLVPFLISWLNRPK